MIMINAANFVDVIFDIEICHHDFLNSVIIDSGVFHLLKACYYYTIFQILEATILLHFICKLMALLKGQMITSKEFSLSFC